ncbi:MAG TPA: glycosyltransferase family A protein [Acidobacteriota bacterium]|nr:glycosyltransferase family A protein [Acidobacteriota bacterium]
MSRTVVSVIIPVYNGERYLDAALKSVLDQDYSPTDVIIIDDGSTDKSAEVAKAYQDFRYIPQLNRGVATARNEGIRVARGEFIAFLDQDDVWTTNKLSLQVSYLLDHPEVGYAICNEKLFLESGTQLPSWLKEELLSKDHPGYVPSALIVRKSIFDRVGLFDPSYVMGSDSDWFARAKDQEIQMAVLPETLLQRRIHNSNCSSQTKLAMQELRRVVKASIDRQRQQKL